MEEADFHRKETWTEVGKKRGMEKRDVFSESAKGENGK